MLCVDWNFVTIYLTSNIRRNMYVTVPSRLHY